jgi:hypothetical protein
MKYEDVVQSVCGKGWRSDSENEKDAGYGVAMMIAFLKGTTPDLVNLSTHLEIPSLELVRSFSRMLRCGMFEEKNKRDNELIGNGFSETVFHNDFSKKYWTVEKAYVCAWGYIAGIASGSIDRV